MVIVKHSQNWTSYVKSQYLHAECFKVRDWPHSVWIFGHICIGHESTS